uniref:Uncharacterized protein LOC104249561 n=1 Tax=Nicotiana sylvestris TaxID=4096 RepID=A0A1U7YYT1_NICSY|nr:PREDICTED: uncharacterized protein LOC104249561 [Nicotiana sylvestris]
MSADIAKLANQMTRMTMQQPQTMQHVQQMTICYELCGNSHMSDMCPTNPESIYYVGQQNRDPPNQHTQYENSYNLNWRNHPNFSWGGNQQNQNQHRPQGSFNQPQRPPQQMKESALPSDTEKNPQVNAVTLRNGRELEEVPKKKKDKPIPEGEFIPKVIHEPKNAAEIPKPVQLNIPLVDVLREIPKYAKYIKDIVAHKRRLTEFETVALTEECTSRVQNNLPKKLKDPGSFTIPVRIAIGPGSSKAHYCVLQLADRSIAHPEGVIEDVLLQIGKFIFPADFIILNYEAYELVPIILGRPLLATGDAISK